MAVFRVSCFFSKDTRFKDVKRRNSAGTSSKRTPRKASFSRVFILVNDLGKCCSLVQDRFRLLKQGNVARLFGREVISLASIESASRPDKRAIVSGSDFKKLSPRILCGNCQTIF